MSLLFIILICSCIGVVAGFLAGLLGIGGGLVIVPALCFLLPLWGVADDHVLLTAIATSLMTIIFTGFSSLKTHHKNGNVTWGLVGPLAIGVALATTAMAMVADRFSADGLQMFFAISVFILALKMAFFGNPVSSIEVGKKGLVAIGGLTGGISSLLGIGGGAILVPFLTWYHVDMKKAIGSASACTMVVALFGTFGYIISGLDEQQLPPYTVGYIYLPAFAGIVMTSVLTAPVGANLTTRLDTKKLKKVFAVFLMVVAIKMMFS